MEEGASTGQNLAMPRPNPPPSLLEQLLLLSFAGVLTWQSGRIVIGRVELREIGGELCGLALCKCNFLFVMVVSVCFSLFPTKVWNLCALVNFNGKSPIVALALGCLISFFAFQFLCGW